MEALVIIFGELVYAILAPFVVLIVDFIGGLFALLLEFIGYKRRRSESEGSGRFARAVTIALLATGVLLLAAIWIVNSFFFEKAVRHVFNAVEERSGVTADCNGIDGSLFTGRVALQDCQFSRLAHPISTFDLSVDDVVLDLRITSLLGTATLDSAAVTGLSGWVVKAPAPEEDDAAPAQTEKPRRNFVIDQLTVLDVDVAISGTNADGNAYALPVQVETLTSAPLRSRMALFDVLFRSTASGSIAGAPFSIASREIKDGRNTQWRASQVPVASLGNVSGGILSWFSAGFVDVYVDDEWQLGDGVNINMDWRLEFQQLEVSAPEGTSRFAKMASGPLVRYVNGFDGQFPLEFSMVLNEQQFLYKSSLATAGLWSALGKAVNNTLRQFGIDPDDAKETGDKLKEGAISVLDRVRKRGKDDETD